MFEVLVFGIGALTIVFGYAVAFGIESPKGRARRRLKGGVVRGVDEFRDGQAGMVRGVVVEGKAHLIAPASGRRCVAYHVTVSDSYGVDSQKLSKIVDFRIESTGEVLQRSVVDTEECEFMLDMDFDLQPGSPVPPAIAALHPMNTDLFVREGIIAEGHLALAQGVGVWEVDPDPPRTPGYRDIARRLRIHPNGLIRVTVQAIWPPKPNPE